MWLLVALCFLVGQGADKKTQSLGKKSSEWGYDFSLKHVSKGWGQTCLHGERQSPIALPPADQLKEWKNSIPTIDWNKGRRVKIVGKATGKTLKFTGENNIDLGKVTVGTEDYGLKYVELHMPSEHTIGGKQSALEIQFVHENKKTEHSKVIVSILCDESDDENLPTMNVFINRMVGIQDGTKEDACPGDKFGKPMELDLHSATIGQFETKKMNKLFYRYIGSETTPPCKEKVKWIVMGAQCRLKNEKIVTWLKKQDSLQKNFRPPQPVNGRVLYIGPTMDKEKEFKWSEKDGGKKEEPPKKKPQNNEIKKKTKDNEIKDEDAKKKEKEEEEDKDKDKKSDEKADDKKKSSKDKKKGEDDDEKSKDKKAEGKGDDEKSKDKKAEGKGDDEKSKDKKKGENDDKKTEGEKDGDKKNEKKDDGKDDGKEDEKNDGKGDEKNDGKADDGKGDDGKGDDGKGDDGKADDGKGDDKDAEKKPEDEDDDKKDNKASAHASASLNNSRINSHVVKPILGFGIGFSFLLTLFCIFNKRRKNEYLDSLLEDEV